MENALSVVWVISTLTTAIPNVAACRTSDLIRVNVTGTVREITDLSYAGSCDNDVFTSHSCGLEH